MADLGRLVFDLVDRIAAAHTVTEVWDAFHGAAREARLGCAVACSLLAENFSMPKIVAEAFPKGCIKGYTANGLFAGDLILERARHSIASFEWHLSDWDVATMTPIQRRWREHCTTFGLTEGLCITHFLRGDQMILIVCGSDGDLTPHNRLTLYFAGHEALVRMREVEFGSAAASAFLSQRERECLQWVAAGKTDWEIGQILSLSEKTVNVYVDRAKQKFGVKTRAQAVVLASRSGLIVT